MADLKYYDILLKPLTTEKAISGNSEGRYVFFVHPDATKIQIKEAVEKLFSAVTVEKINTLNLRGKIKRRGNTKGRRVARKKAIVKLTADSQQINIF
ncbi:MAG: 50S ribosomal protein L23 [Clostridiales bacterium]|nr:50S ribosomal protein L23 [Clostridiales bacterium]